MLILYIIKEVSKFSGTDSETTICIHMYIGVVWGSMEFAKIKRGIK